MNNGSVIGPGGVGGCVVPPNIQERARDPLPSERKTRMADSVKQGAGLRNVVAGESSISSIDGERGVLAYRGIDIHALGEQSTFEEVVFKLPRKDELAAFEQELARARAVPAEVLAILALFPASTHPMTSLRSVVSAMGAFDPDGRDDSPPANARKALRL